MTSSPLVIIGSGRAGRFTRDIAVDCGYSVTGFLDDFRAPGDQVDDTPVLGPTTRLEEPGFLEDSHLALAVGDIGFRLRMLEYLQRFKRSLTTLIHPNSVVSPYAALGEGCVVHAFCSVYAGAQLGRGVIVEDHGSIGIDVAVGDGCLLAPGVRLTAQVRVGPGCFLGVGSVVAPEVCVGGGSMLGAGASVVHDIAANSLAVGVPARVIKPSPLGLNLPAF